nr:type II CAAX endopeptidase family protein [bacterium]
MNERTRAMAAAGLGGFAGLVIFQALGGVMGMLLMAMGLELSGVSLLIGNTLCGLIALGGVGFIMRRLAGLGKNGILPPGLGLLTGTLCGGPAILLFSAVTLLWMLLLNRMGLPDFAAGQDLVEGSPLWLQIALAGLVVPVYEEYFYRGALQCALQKATASRWGAILFTGILFGASHGSIQALPAMCLMGIMLGFTASVTGSCWTSAAMHAVYNMLVILIGYFQTGDEAIDYGMPIWQALVQVFIFAVAMAALLAVCALLARRRRALDPSRFKSFDKPAGWTWLVLIAPMMVAAGLLALDVLRVYGLLPI